MKTVAPARAIKDVIERRNKEANNSLRTAVINMYESRCKQDGDVIQVFALLLTQF